MPIVDNLRFDVQVAGREVRPGEKRFRWTVAVTDHLGVELHVLECSVDYECQRKAWLDGDTWGMLKLKDIRAQRAPSRARRGGGH